MRSWRTAAPIDLRFPCDRAAVRARRTVSSVRGWTGRRSGGSCTR